MVNFAKWLEDLGLAKYAEVFAQNNVDADVLPILLKDDLKDMGITAVGDLRKLENAIKALSNSQNGSVIDRVGEPALLEEQVHSFKAERRQTTLMFCDLVDSTLLADQLDPEELNNIFKTYREKCFQVVHQLDVRDVRTIGDGLLITFGYPQAHEDDPRRAVSAGLAIITSIAKLNDEFKSLGIELRVRIGIHTGLVVVEDAGSGNKQYTEVVGMPAHIAARLQSLAQPNTVLVSSFTHDLIKNNFETENMGFFDLKGVGDPIEVHRVVRESKVKTRDFTPLVEREIRQKLIYKKWQETTLGTGRVVLIQGEAGIGKTRLVRALKQRLSEENLGQKKEYERLECRCTAIYNNSPFHAVVDLFERTARIDRSDNDEAKIEKLEIALQSNDLDLQEYVPLLAPLLSIQLNENYEPINLTPKGKEVATRNAIVKILIQLSEKYPVLFIVEDLHWIDPSTRMILDEIVAQGPMSAICAIFTFRPKNDFLQTWGGRDHVTQITLDRLSKDGAKTMAENITSVKLSSDVLEHIIERTDGVPLYIEELTKMLIESGQLEEGKSGYQFSKTVKNLEIPKTLDGPLIARLDMLGAAKLISQQASTLGRSFSYKLLSAVFVNEQFVLDKGLDQLAQAEILYRQGRPPDSNYYFKHSLIQDAAYKTLLLADRKKYHERIAKVLEGQFLGTKESAPEILAHHYLQAECYEKAVQYWRQANIKARKQAANNEAIAHIEMGLRYVDRIEDIRLRTQRQIQLLLAKGLTLTALKGYAADEVLEVLIEAEQLSQEFGDSDLLFQVLRGLQSYFLVKGPLSKALELGEQLLDLAKAAGERTQIIEANRRLGWCLFCLGKIRSAIICLESAISDYNEDRSQDHILFYGSDAAVTGYSTLALARWFLNLQDSAIEAMDESVSIARKLKHPLSLAYALGLSSMLYQWRQLPGDAEKYAEETIQLAEENYLPYWVALGKCLKGWACASQKSKKDGLVVLLEGISEYRNTGAELFLPYLQGLLAEVLHMTGDSKEAFALIENAISDAERLDVRYFNSEFYRLKSRIISDSQQSYGDASGCLETALAIGRKQDARWLVGKVVADLKSLLDAQGRSKEGRLLAAEFENMFDESSEPFINHVR